MEDVVDAACGLGHCLCRFGCETCRGNLSYVAVVLGIVVEELILRDDLRSRQDHGLVLSLVYSLRYLGSLKIRLNHNLGALHERYAQSGSELVGVLHLTDTEATAVSGRFDEDGHTEALLNLLLVVLLATAEQDAVGNIDAETTEVVVEHELIEGHGLDKHSTRRIGQMDEVEVSLNRAVLAWLSVDSDICIVEHHDLTLLIDEGEVVTVDRCRRAVLEIDVPVLSLDVDDVDVVLLLIEEGVKSLS